MKSKRTIKKKMCMLTMLSFLACTLVPLNIFIIPKVNATAQEDLNNALTWAKAYLDRSYTDFGMVAYNRISNPGFELWTLGKPNNWDVRIGSSVIMENSVVHSGSHSAKLVGTVWTGTSITPGTLTLTPSSNRTYSYSVWIRYDSFPSIEYRIGINTQSSEGKSVYIEMGVAPSANITFAAVIEDDVYIYGLNTYYAKTGVWTNWDITFDGQDIKWYYGEDLIGSYTYNKLDSKPMTPDIVLPGDETGLMYVDDTFFGLPNVMSAAMRDLPGLPFVMHDVTDDKWMCPAKATQAVKDGNDGPDWGYYGGCGIDIIDWGYDKNFIKLKYRWDTECDNTYDGVIMEVWLVTLNNIDMECTAIIQSKADPDHCALWFNDEKVIDPVVKPSSFSRTKAYGWFTTRFIVRHGTKIAANMYETLGETDKADKLLNMWYGSGYTKDTYDGIWNASNSYSDYGFQFIEGGIISVPWLAVRTTVIPDYEIWGNIPWFHYPNPEGVPYRSQLHNYLVQKLGFETGPPITPGISWWMSGFTAKMAWACHLLNKYGITNPAKLAEAKQLIDDVSWNGLGINCETVRVGSLLISIYQYACYVPYANAEYLAALTKYWELTGDEWYGQRADEVAGILLRTQVKPGDKIRIADSSGNIRLIWRPDNTGGFMCGYKYGGGFDFASNPWLLADAYFWVTSNPIFGVEGFYNRDLAELSSCGWTNHETTLMCYAALYQYRQTGRTPLTSEMQVVCPVFNAKITTSQSGAGCYFFEVNNERVNLFIEGTIFGESWAKVTYTWGVTLPSCTNFRTGVTFFSGSLYGTDGNAIERGVLIYDSAGTLVVSDYDKPIDGVGGKAEFYVINNSMTRKSSLPADVYTIKLIFRFSCGWAGSLYVGSGGEPFRVESFGYDYDVALPQHILQEESVVDIVKNGGFENNLNDWSYNDASIATDNPYEGSKYCRVSTFFGSISQSIASFGYPGTFMFAWKIRLHNTGGGYRGFDFYVGPIKFTTTELYGQTPVYPDGHGGYYVKMTILAVDKSSQVNIPVSYDGYTTNSSWHTIIVDAKVASTTVYLDDTRLYESPLKMQFSGSIWAHCNTNYVSWTGTMDLDDIKYKCLWFPTYKINVNSVGPGDVSQVPIYTALWSYAYCDQMILKLQGSGTGDGRLVAQFQGALFESNVHDNFLYSIPIPENLYYYKRPTSSSNYAWLTAKIYGAGTWLFNATLCMHWYLNGHWINHTWDSDIIGGTMEIADGTNLKLNAVPYSYPSEAYQWLNATTVQLIIGKKSGIDISAILTKNYATILKTISIGAKVALLVNVPNDYYFVLKNDLKDVTEYVEPRQELQLCYTPNDPRFSEQWGLAKINITNAWDNSLGSHDIKIALIDTGINYNHPDLSSNYITGGYDWINKDNDPMDDHGHGSFCAGIIAATINNAIGISGIANVAIFAEKIFNATAGAAYDDIIAQAVVHATDAGANIISMSFGGYLYSSILYDAVKYAYDHGVLLVAAAGNNGVSFKQYPAAFSEVIAVSAMQQNNNIASWSNYGEWIDVAAPGVNIMSTWLSGYEMHSGTSAACPFVSGLAGLLWSYRSSASRDWIRGWMTLSANDLGEPGFDQYFGYGCINASRALGTLLSHDVGITRVICASGSWVASVGNNVFRVTATNFGTSTEDSLVIGLSVRDSSNNLIYDDFAMIGIYSFSSKTRNFTVSIPSSGMYKILAYVFLVGDENPLNDESTRFIMAYGTPCFRYWNVNNTKMGYSQNFTANPLNLYINHDYNVTAYFEDTPGVPTTTYKLTISNNDPTLGTTSPSPQTYTYYIQNTSVVVTAIPNTGNYFKYWNLDGVCVFDNPITVTMNTDHSLVSYFSNVMVRFKVYNSLTKLLLIDGVYVYRVVGSTWSVLPTTKHYSYIQTMLPAGTYNFAIFKSGYYVRYVASVTVPPDAYFYVNVYLDPVLYGGGFEGCPRLIVCDTDLGVIDIHASHDVVKYVDIPSNLISSATSNGYTLLTLVEGFPGLTVSESYIDYVALNGKRVVKAKLNGGDVTERLLWSDDVKVFIKLNDVLELYFSEQKGDSVFTVEGVNVIKQSSLITFYASMPYSNYTTNFYIDFDRLIWCEPLPNTVAKLKLVVHYETDYPIIEIEAENVAFLKFDITELYSHYAKESYPDKISRAMRASFTGLLIDSTSDLTIEIQGISRSPSELWKLEPGQDLPGTRFTGWEYSGNSLFIDFKAGDPTLSMFFPSRVAPSVLVMLQVALPIIALVGFGMLFIKERPESIEDIVVYVVAFIVIGVIMPIAIGMLVSG